MPPLITGVTGKLGRELAKEFPDAFRPTHGELDITDKAAVHAFIRERKPEMIIHAAALTDVRECEENKFLAYRINVDGTSNLVGAIVENNVSCYFVYVSTACVFQGDRGNYDESDLPYPKNFYALTKLLGEFVVRYSRLEKQLTIRTNFVPREKWPYPKAFVDRYGTYLFADDLASAIKSVVARHPTGIIHVCGEERISMFEVAKITTPQVGPLSLAEYHGPPLTADMSLRSIRIGPFRMNKARS